MVIRKYNDKDQKSLVSILKLNTPKYFSPKEQSDFIDYLNSSIQDYFVVELDGQVVGGGGINYFLSQGIARISWDIIHPQYQNRKIGTNLLNYRLDRIHSNLSIDCIVVRTSQHAFHFYEKTGFELNKIVKDYWAPGFNFYEMKLKCRTLN